MRVAVFAKAPVAGEVKTRLAALLGAEGAAALHAGLVRRALAIAREARIGRVELWCAPDAGHPFFTRCADEFRVDLFAQEGANLGERLRNAFARAAQEGAALIAIGCDCAVLLASHLRTAAAALTSHDAVLAPAEDGGYVLLGLAREVPGLFDGIEWGGDAVLRQTRERLARAGVAFVELPVLWDIDRPEDYARLQREGLVPEVMS